MDTSIVKYMAFVKTVETGSFTKASELLSYSQSGISRMINDLEKEWGVILLERNKNGVKLTSDGTKILPYVKNVCEEYNKLQMQIDDINGLQSGLIRIGTISSIATHRIPDMISQFQKNYPSIEFELLLGHYADIEKWIDEGRVDFGFTRVPTKMKLDFQILEEDKLLVVLPQNHPLASLDKIPVTALDNERFILLEKGEKADISDLLDRYNIKPDIHFTTVDDYAVMSMVEKGLGISILPELILKRIPYNIEIRELEIPAYRELGIAMKNSKTQSLAVKRFLECIELQIQLEPIRF